MLPRSWFYLSLLVAILIAGCQPIRPVAELTPTPDKAPAAVVPSTTTVGATDCPILADQPIDLIITPQWQEGEVRRYQASRSTTKIRDGESDPTIITTSALTVTVLSAGEDGYVLEWRYITLLSRLRRVRLEYATNELGEFANARNLHEIEIEYDPLDIWQLENLRRARVTDREDVDRSVERLLSDPERFTAFVANDIQTYHFIYGLYFTEATPFVLEQPAILTESGTHHITVTPLRYDATQGCLHILWQSDLEVEPTDDKFERDPFTVQTKVTTELDLNTGWIQTIDIERTTLIAGNGQIERLHLTYSPPAE